MVCFRAHLGIYTPYDCRIRLFVLTYLINSQESSGRIPTPGSESETGIVPSQQHYIPQDEQ